MNGVARVGGEVKHGLIASFVLDLFLFHQYPVLPFYGSGKNRNQGLESNRKLPVLKPLAFNTNGTVTGTGIIV